MNALEFTTEMVRRRAHADKAPIAMSAESAQQLLADDDATDRMFGRVAGRRLRQRLTQLLKLGASRWGDDEMTLS